MHETGKPGKSEYELDRKFELANDVINRVERIIKNSPDAVSTDLLSAELGLAISNDPEMDQSIRSTALYYMKNRFRLASAHLPEGHAPLELHDANFSVLTRHDEDSGTVTFHTFTNVHTTDGGHSRCASVVWYDEFIQKSYAVSIDGFGHLDAVGKIDLRIEGTLREVYNKADEDESMMLAGLLGGGYKVQENLDFALDSIRKLAEKACMPYEVEELMQELRDRHESRKSAREFYDTVDTDKLSEYDLVDLLNFIDALN
jgi:hypothetical protein